ncbi:hypothetical protein HanIR_Chr08g0389091 [Helianthus annuus]|nr:hypothetical protein HanIR_Chr08g0389091 [Helianthus annuus]
MHVIKSQSSKSLLHRETRKKEEAPVRNKKIARTRVRGSDEASMYMDAKGK